MAPSPQRVFGKRNTPHHAPRGGVVLGAEAEPARMAHAALFERFRAETDDRSEKAAVMVPRSYRAASLAGLVVGCALAGFNVTDARAASDFTVLAARFGAHVDTTNLLPAMILLGLLSGARAAAFTLLLLHWLLERAQRRDHLSYALCGAATSASTAGLLALGPVHGPAHGWVIECLSGAAAALMYRILAGTKPA